VIIVFEKDTGKIACSYQFLPPNGVGDSQDFIEVQDGSFRFTMFTSHLVDLETRELIQDPAYGFALEWSRVRQERDSRLAETDYLVMPDYPITDECRAEFVTYRQALRDVTNVEKPSDVVWPVKPTIVMKSSASNG
jgi:hypothetical protein